jgi:hypothetical protein
MKVVRVPLHSRFHISRPRDSSEAIGIYVFFMRRGWTRYGTAAGHAVVADMQEQQSGKPSGVETAAHAEEAKER